MYINAWDIVLCLLLKVSCEKRCFTLKDNSTGIFDWKLA